MDGKIECSLGELTDLYARFVIGTQITAVAMEGRRIGEYDSSGSRRSGVWFVSSWVDDKGSTEFKRMR